MVKFLFFSIYKVHKSYAHLQHALSHTVTRIVTHTITLSHYHMRTRATHFIGVGHVGGGGTYGNQHWGEWMGG